ncbi:hypothetical protein ACFPJ1_27505 [Kribbella qitaiheensis]|uniref:hypothetical protein n=1 Tax=Kribbella qitaiheensis TaxID=1544730 RepID=UPI003611F60B
MPNVGNEDQFEDVYTGKFRALVAQYGTIIKYERDRAGIDIGLHLHGPSSSQYSSPLADAKVWFQLKGKHAKTLPAHQLASATIVSSSVSLELLKFWYAQPEAVYIAIYLEATGEFILEDVRDIVDRMWGERLFAPSTFTEGQQSVTLHVRRAAILDAERLGLLLRHRSMRIDGPSWRGRPLGHRFDPLRSALAPMDPDDYRALVLRLLEVHGFEEQERLDPALLLGSPRPQGDRASLSMGRMHYTYEWTHPAMTEFGYDEGETFRIEGQMFQAQGPCAVLIHEQPEAIPRRSDSSLLSDLLKDRGVEKLLVFVNAPFSPALMGGYKVAAKHVGCIAQDLDSLAFNVLTATLIYLEFRDRLEWRFVNYLHHRFGN